MNKLICIGTILAATGLAASGFQPPAQRAAEAIAIINANLVNVRDGRVIPNATIVIRDGRIESIGFGAAAGGERAIDVKGKYVLPGLIDAHTHAADFESFRRALESGVTTMRSAGVSFYADVGFHQLVKSGAVAGPDIVAVPLENVVGRTRNVPLDFDVVRTARAMGISLGD